jgi:predicted helicase
MEEEIAREGYNLGKDARDWKIKLAQKDLLDSGPSKDKIVPILYRPFDVRYTYYTGRSRGFICRPRPEVMRHMLAARNLALIVPRRVEYLGNWQHTFVSEQISDHVVVSLKTIDYHFPLYLYPDRKKQDLFSSLEPSLPKNNINPRLLDIFEEAIPLKLEPETVFYYIYAILYIPIYREKYAEFLRRDFPRIPITFDYEVFRDLVALGKRLVELHLLNSPELDTPAIRFTGQGDERVERRSGQGLHYDMAEERIFINKTQYFSPVPPEVWEYQIGAYHVCEKWLADRKDRHLNLEEIRTYCRLVTAIKLTITIQEELDALYPKIEEHLADIIH